MGHSDRSRGIACDGGYENHMSGNGLILGLSISWRFPKGEFLERSEI